MGGEGREEDCVPADDRTVVGLDGVQGSQSIIRCFHLHVPLKLRKYRRFPSIIDVPPLHKIMQRKVINYDLIPGILLQIKLLVQQVQNNSLYINLLELIKLAIVFYDKRFKELLLTIIHLEFQLISNMVEQFLVAVDQEDRYVVLGHFSVLETCF